MMRVEYLSVPGPSVAGFVVCLIPESVHKPHRAEFADKHYYYRAGDDFLMAEPGLLRTLFSPQNRPQLKAVAMMAVSNPSSFPTGELGFDISIRFFLLNRSSYSATNLFVVVNHDWEDHPESVTGADWEFVGFRLGESIMNRTQYSLHEIAFASERPLAPGLNTLVGIVKWEKKYPIELVTMRNSEDNILLQDSMTINLSIFGDSIEAIRCHARFVGKDFEMNSEMTLKDFDISDPEE